MDSIIVHRVSYGKQSTPAKDREYVAGFWGSPVGTKAEWRAWAKKSKKKVVFRERPKKRVFVNQ